MNGSDYKRRVLAAVPIESYIGKYVALKKHGRYLTGLCPFHQEKTPSFTVTPEKGIYHCFGCGKGGDVIRFVMDIEGLPFLDALNLLAGQAGIERPDSASRGGRDDGNDLLIKINEKAMSLYSAMLIGSTGGAALKYLTSRGIPRELIDLFHLGLAPDSWSYIADRAGGEAKKFEEAGLIRRGKSGFYDFFRNRLMFPIQDTGGRVIAFGGRILAVEEGSAKYINSPESPLFHKGSTLYGLFQASAEIRKARECCVVEGYLDVIGLHGAGVKNVVAPLGTAITADHFRIVKRYAERVIMIFDGDKAGRAAAVKAARLVVESGGLLGSIVLLPEGVDPHDLSTRFPRETVHRALNTRIDAGRFLMMETLFPGRVTSLVDDPDPELYINKTKELYGRSPSETFRPDGEEKRGAIRRLFEFLKEISGKVDRDIYLSDAALLIGVDGASLKDEWNRYQGGAPAAPSDLSRASGVRRGGDRPDPLQAMLIKIERGILIEFLNSVRITGEYLEAMSSFRFYDSHSEFLWRFLESRYMTGMAWLPQEFIGFDLPEKTVGIFTGELTRYEELLSESGESERMGVLKQLLGRHRICELKKKLGELDIELSVADAVTKDSLIESRAALITELKKMESEESEDLSGTEGLPPVG